jgi:sensor c-di-GMP phosphodiesterase-like protein
MSLYGIRRLLIIIGSVAALLSIAGSLWMSYRTVERNCYSSMVQAAEAWHRAVIFVLETADETLSEVAQEAEGQPIPEVQKTLKQVLFDHPVFREAGWIVDDHLVCTSFTQINPPREIEEDAAKQALSSSTGIWITPPLMTTLGGPSLIINKRVNDSTIVNLLLSPKSLLLPLSQSVNDPEIAVFLLRNNGDVILRSESADDMDVPARVPTVDFFRRYGNMIFNQPIESFNLEVVSVLPRPLFFSRWVMQLPVYGLLGVVAAGLFLIGTWQLREKVFGLRAEIREGIKLRQFEPYFQPVISLTSGKCEGAEILVRWQHPVRGTVPPNLFIPEAEAGGLLGDLTLAMLARNPEEMNALLVRFGNLHLNLNLSASMLLDDSFLARIQDLMEERDHVKRFHFEVTESVSAGPEVRKRLQEFKDQGIKLAVDDFGTGYSNLRYLKDYPFDYLKIDKAFVDGISSSTESSGLIDSIVGIGQNCGLHLVAEGVEKLEQVNYLKRAGVQSAQGYFFARPMPLHKFVDWMAKQVSSAA